MTTTMINRINETIRFALMDYKANGVSPWYDRQLSKIYGMIEMLKIVTGKDYYFDENGLHERETA